MARAWPDREASSGRPAPRTVVRELAPGIRHLAGLRGLPGLRGTRCPGAPRLPDGRSPGGGRRLRPRHRPVARPGDPALSGHRPRRRDPRHRVDRRGRPPSDTGPAERGEPMNPLLAGSSILGGFVGGVIALLAPCCVTVLLPAYFAAAFTSIRTPVRMTFLFGAGIAVVILPIALGLAALGQVFSRFHPLLFGVGGLFLLGLGVMTLRGRGFELPFGRAPTFAGRPGLSIFALGLFSGAASSCCAPVLIGVLTLTALTNSFVGAVGVALAYVFGM